MAKKPKPEKADEAEADAPAVEGEEGAAPAKKKLAGKTLVLFIILPALLVLGGGGAAGVMLLGGDKGAVLVEDEHGELRPPAPKRDAGKATAQALANAPEGAADPMNVGWLVPGIDGNPSYYNMPKMIVNLSGSEDDRPLLLELQLVLEAGEPAAFDEIVLLMPRLKDQLLAFLRELRVEDLNGSAGSYRLRLELLKRFNIVLAPARVDAVLIEGILIQ